MNNDTQAAERATEFASLAALVRKGVLTVDSISASKQDAVRKLLDVAPGGMTPQGFHAKQSADRAKFFRELKAQGFKVHRASQQDHDFIFGSILDTVDAGRKPAVKPMLRDYAERHGYAPEWIEKVATKTQRRKMSKSLRAKQQHPVIQDLKEGRMFTQTHQSALKAATYSGLAEMLFSGSQNTREKREMQLRLTALETRLTQVQAEANRANARLDLMDAGIDWKEKARSILACEPDISRRELARRVGKSDAAVRKYWDCLEAAHAPPRS